MRNIDINEFKKLLQIIKEYPNVRVGYFSDNKSPIPLIIKDYCNNKELEFVLNATTKDYYEEIKDIKEARYFNLDRPKYLLNGKFYDYFFVDCNINNKDSFLKKAHSTIKNGGLIIIFLNETTKKEQKEWEELLEKNYYVATNKIEIDNKNSVLISRKMHGWGG